METLVQSCQENAVSGMEHFLKVFSFVPDDRLDWAPAPTAKSAMRIAAHTAVYPAAFAQMIRDRRLPLDDVSGFVARMNTAEQAITDRAQMETVFRAGTDEVLIALNSLGPEEIGMRLDSGQGWSMPMAFLMNLPGVHAHTHTGQIDYLQTCWGDHEVHF